MDAPVARLRNSLAAALLMLTAAACGDGPAVAYSGFSHVDREGWHRNDGLEYQIALIDTLSMSGRPCDMAVTVRHTRDSAPDSLTLVIEEFSEGVFVGCDTVSVDLASDSREGISRPLSLRESVAVVRRGCRLRPDPVFAIAHIMPGDTVRGIVDIGLTFTIAR